LVNSIEILTGIPEINDLPLKELTINEDPERRAFTFLTNIAAMCRSGISL